MMLEVSRKLVMLRCTKQNMLTMDMLSGIRSEEQINDFTKYEALCWQATVTEHPLHLHFQCPVEPLSLAAPWTEVRASSFCFVFFSCQPQQLSQVLLRILSDPTSSQNMLLHFFSLNLKVKLSSKQFSPSIVLFSYINLRLFKNVRVEARENR